MKTPELTVGMELIDLSARKLTVTEITDRVFMYVYDMFPGEVFRAPIRFWKDQFGFASMRKNEMDSCPAPRIDSFALTGKEVLLYKETNSVCKIDSINKEFYFFTWSAIGSEMQGICHFKSFSKDFDIISEETPPAPEVVDLGTDEKSGVKMTTCGPDPARDFERSRRMFQAGGAWQEGAGIEDELQVLRKKLIGKRINVAGNVAFATAVRDKLDSLRFQRSQQFVHSFDPDWISIINEWYYISEHDENTTEISVWDVITREEFMISNGQVTEDYMAKPVENQEQTKTALEGIHGYPDSNGFKGLNDRPDHWKTGIEKRTEVIREYFASLGVPDGIVIGDEVVGHNRNSEIPGEKLTGVFAGVKRNGMFLVDCSKENPFNDHGDLWWCHEISRPKKQPAEKSAREEAVELIQKHWSINGNKNGGIVDNGFPKYAVDAIEEALTKNQK